MDTEPNPAGTGALNTDLAGGKRPINNTARPHGITGLPSFSEEETKPLPVFEAQASFEEGLEKGSDGKRQKLCDRVDGVVGSESKDVMVANMKTVVGRMISVGTREHVAVKNLLEEFKDEFGYEFDVKIVAGHASFTRYVRDQFRNVLKLEIDGQGEYWASSRLPPDSLQEQQGSLTILGDGGLDDGSPNVCKGLEYVKSLYSVPKERDNATRVHMLVMRQLLQRKFERWMEWRNHVTSTGEAMPDLSEVLRSAPTLAKRVEPVEYSTDQPEIISSSVDSPDSKPVKLYFMSDLVEDYKGCFKQYALHYEDLLQFVSKDPTYRVNTDSFGIQSIEEADPSSSLFAALLKIRLAITNAVLKMPNGPIREDRLESALRQDGLLHKFQEMGYKNLDHFLRNTVMSDVLTDRGKNKKVDPVQNVRKFFQGRLWAKMAIHPNRPLPFIEIRSAFEEMYHELEPYMLGSATFDAGPCHRMNDIFSLESGVDGQLYVTSTPIGKLRWLVKSMLNDAEGELDPKDGIPLSAVHSRFLSHFKNEISLSEIGFSAWQSALLSMKDIVWFVEPSSGSDIILFPPREKELNSKIPNRQMAHASTQSASLSPMMLRPTGPRYVSLPVPRQQPFAQDVFRLKPCTYAPTQLLNPLAPVACMNPSIANFPNQIGLAGSSMTLAQLPPPPPPPPPPPRTMVSEHGRASNCCYRLKWVTSDFVPEPIQDPGLRGRRGNIWEESWEALGVNPDYRHKLETFDISGGISRRKEINVNGLKGTAEELKPWGT